MFLRTPFNYDRDAVSLETGLVLPVDEDGQLLADDMFVQQHFAEESDINEIVRRFGLTGQLPQSVQMPQSGDFRDAPDFHTAMNLVRQAQEQFLTVPAHIRERFGHDPARLMSFLEDVGNREEAIKLGLVPKPPEVSRDVVMAVDELAAKLVPPVVK